MKKNISILLIVLLILVISTLILFAEETEYDFRKTNWGMNKEQVKVTEDKKPGFETDTMLSYEVTISGKDSKCDYFFLEDKLYSSGYFFTGEHISKNLYTNYINEYIELRKLLTKKYGKPKMDIYGLWLSSQYKDSPSFWALAICAGHLVYAAEWETSTTKIHLRLSGDDYKIIKLILSYHSKDLEEWVKQTKEKEALKDL